MDAPSAPRRPLVWLEIRRHVEALIASAGLGPGDRVPSERALADQLGANRMTVRKAIDSLVADGLLERHSTSGTRLPQPRVHRPAGSHTALGISRLVRAGGGTPGNRLLDFAIRPAPPRIAARLALAPGADAVTIARLLTVDATPFCVETTWLPAARVPGLAAADLTHGESLYGLLRTRHGIVTRARRRSIRIGHATDEEAALLRLAPGAAVLVLRLLSDDIEGAPVEYTTSVNHPRLVEFRTGDDGD